MVKLHALRALNAKTIGCNFGIAFIMSSGTPKQLSLGISLNDDATFDNFFCALGNPNEQALVGMKQQLTDQGEQLVLLWGEAGVGLTHLLQAACHHAESLGLHAQYLPLKDVSGFNPEHLLDGLEQLDIVCLDALEVVAGHPIWERTLFHLFNRMRDANKCLLIACHVPPAQLDIRLPDLKSRLQWGVTFRIHALSDDEKCEALALRARGRGLEMSREVSQYILKRAPRDMNELFYLLERLDEASLAEQRRLTIPFVKQTLGL